MRWSLGVLAALLLAACAQSGEIAGHSAAQNPTGAHSTRGESSLDDRFGSERWSILLPKGWRGTWEGDVAGIYHPNGVGALQISGYQKLEEVTDEDLLMLIQEVPKEQATAFSTARFVGFHISYVEGASHWETWFLRHADLMLYVTYNCAVADAGIEQQSVLTAVRSIMPRG